MPPDRASFGQNSFQIIRLVLAVAVLYRHSFDLLASSHADVVLDLIPPRTHLGRIALCLFMVVSGFLVTHSWFESAGWRDFLWRRVLRVYPAFIMAAMLSAFVAAPLGTPNPASYLDSIDLGRFLADLVQLNKLSVPPSFLINPFPGPVNGSLWSIKIELECYLMLMALGLIGALRWRAGILGLFALLLVGHAIQGYVPSRLDRFGNHVQLATFFLSGTVAYLYRDRIRWSYGWLEVAGLVTVVTAIVEVGFVELLPIFGTYILLYLAYEPRLASLGIGRRPDLSYGIYLYAWPVQQLLIQALGPGISPYVLTVLALIISAGLAWLSWRFVERPFLALKRRQSPTTSPSPVREGREQAILVSPPPCAREGPGVGDSFS
jgi:peptidoglycan/LPS O-acetylase OafA/YrhL